MHRSIRPFFIFSGLAFDRVRCAVEFGSARIVVLKFGAVPAIGTLMAHACLLKPNWAEFSTCLRIKRDDRWRVMLLGQYAYFDFEC